MLANRLLGALQAQIASPLIGLLLGPAAVGAFDAVCRLPRFVKSILSLLSTTVLPVSAGLKARADTDSLRRLGNIGILAALTISAPPILFGMAYSEALLHYWIGDAVTAYWGWQSAMFVVTLLNVTLSFGGAILLADAAASSALTRLAAWQVGLQVVLSLALLHWLGQWAFVLGQAVSAALVFPFQFAEIRNRLDLGGRLFRQFLLLAAFAGLIALGLRLMLPAPGLIALIALAAGYGLVVWGLLPWVLLDAGERAGLFARLKARAPGLHSQSRADMLKGGAGEGSPPPSHGME